jgi:hypothetical protein
MAALGRSLCWFARVSQRDTLHPPLRQPFAIIRIRSKSLKGKNNNAQRNAGSEAKHRQFLSSVRST